MKEYSDLYRSERFKVKLIEVYERMYFDELSDEEADYYNERIRHFEKGEYAGTRKVDLNTIRE